MGGPARPCLAGLSLAELRALAVLLDAAIAAHEGAAARGVAVSAEIMEDGGDRVLSVWARSPGPEARV